MFFINSPQQRRIAACVNIMKMNTFSAFAELSVSLRPFRCRFHILFETLITIFVRNIKVNYDVVYIGWLCIVKFSCIYIRQLCLHILPFFIRNFCYCCGILSRPIFTNLIKDGFRFSEFEPRRLCFFFLYVVAVGTLKFIGSKTTIIVPNSGTIFKSVPFFIFVKIVLQFFPKYPQR